jgi:hypothetical protein
MRIFTPKQLRNRVWPTVGRHLELAAVLLKPLSPGVVRKDSMNRGLNVLGRRGSCAKHLENRGNDGGILVNATNSRLAMVHLDN